MFESHAVDDVSICGAEPIADDFLCEFRHSLDSPSTILSTAETVCLQWYHVEKDHAGSK
jgi:hypothetical protein